jgi:magnesium-transporting ATPase (P-type)
VNVTRNGNETQILSTEFLVDDLISFKNGDAVPVDYLYILGYNFKINLSQITSDFIYVQVNPKANYHIRCSN